MQNAKLPNYHGTCNLLHNCCNHIAYFSTAASFAKLFVAYTKYDNHIAYATSFALLSQSYEGSHLQYDLHIRLPPLSLRLRARTRTRRLCSFLALFVRKRLAPRAAMSRLPACTAMYHLFRLFRLAFWTTPTLIFVLYTGASSCPLFFLLPRRGVRSDSASSSSPYTTEFAFFSDLKTGDWPAPEASSFSEKYF